MEYTAVMNELDTREDVKVMTQQKLIKTYERRRKKEQQEYRSERDGI